MRNCTILVGDVMTRLKQMRTESVHCIVTSPPYFGLRAYGTEPQVWGGEKDCDHEWILYGQTKSYPFPGEVRTAIVDQFGEPSTRSNVERDAKASLVGVDRRVQPVLDEERLELKGKVFAASGEAGSLSLIDVPVSIKDSANETPQEAPRNRGKRDRQAFTGEDTKPAQSLGQFATPNDPAEGDIADFSSLAAHRGIRADKITHECSALFVKADKVNRAIVHNTTIGQHQAEPVGQIAAPLVEPIEQDGVAVESIANEPLLPTCKGTDGIGPRAQLPSGSIDIGPTDPTRNVFTSSSARGRTGLSLANTTGANKKLVSASLTDQPDGHTSIICRKCGAIKCELGLEPTPEMYLDHIVMIFEELRRVLRKDGSLWLNCGDSYAGSGGEGAQGKTSQRVGRNNVLAQKKTKTQRSPKGLKPKDLMMVPARMALALQAAGWWVRSRITWVKDACMPESTRDRPTTSYEDVYLLTKRAKYFYDEFAVREGVTGNTHPPGNRNNPKQGQAEFGTRNNTSFSAALIEVVGSRNLRNVWHILAEPHSDCLCNVCGRYYENPRGLKREKLDAERNPRRPSGWADSDNGDLAGGYGEQTWGKIICECGASDWTQHFAAYPTRLVDICVRAGTSEKGVCGGKVKALTVKTLLTTEQTKRLEAWLKTKGAL